MFAHRFLLSNKLTAVTKSSLGFLRKTSLVKDFTTTRIDLGGFRDDSGDEQPSASILQIKRSLKISNIEFHDGVTNLKTQCPVCESNPSQNIYINKTTGFFMCPSCSYGGKLGLIDKFFSTSRSQKTTNELKTYQKLFQDAKEHYQSENVFDYQNYEKDYEIVREENIAEIFTHFSIDDRIPSSSLISLNARYNRERRELLFPLYNILGNVTGCKIVTNWNRRSDGEDVEKEKDEEREWREVCYPDQNVSGLIAFNNAKTTSRSAAKDKELPQQKAIVVLNIPDLLALMTTKINATFICLPYGLKSLPQEVLPILDQYSELTLWFNYNTAGWDVARNFAKKLDEKRCKFVRPTLAHPTPYKALINSIDIKGIFSKSQPILHKAITTFSSLRQDVLSDLQNIDKVQGVKWKRYPALNKYLKGHRKGELTILTGPTGCGKTTFMSEYSLDLAMQGVNTLWGSFEIRNTRLATTLLRQFCGKSLLESATDDNLLEFEHWANKFEELPIYFMTFHGQQQIKVVMEAIEHAQYVHDINHVIIDNVQFMMGTGDEAKHLDRFWKQDVIIAAFRTFATRKNCHVTLVIHPRKEKDSEDLTTQSIFGGAKATQEADNVLIIQDKRLTSVRGKKYLQIAKNRYSGDLGIMPLDFDKESLSYAQKANKKKAENSESAVAAQQNQPQQQQTEDSPFDHL